MSQEFEARAYRLISAASHAASDHPSTASTVGVTAYDNLVMIDRADGLKESLAEFRYAKGGPEIVHVVGTSFGTRLQKIDGAKRGCRRHARRQVMAWKNYER